MTPIGEDESGFASLARYAYLTAGEWQDRYQVSTFAWRVPVDFRETYTDVHPTGLVKGFAGEVANVELEL